MWLRDPATTLQWRTKQDTQQIFNYNLQRLAAVLYRFERGGDPCGKNAAALAPQEDQCPSDSGEN